MLTVIWWSNYKLTSTLSQNNTILYKHTDRFECPDNILGDNYCTVIDDSYQRVSQSGASH